MLYRCIGRKKKVELIPIIPPAGDAEAPYLFAQSLSRFSDKALKAASAVKPKPEIKPENIQSNLPLTKDINKLKTISISAIAQKLNLPDNQYKQNTPIEDTDKSNNPIDKQLFEEVWIALCNSIKQSGKDSLYITLTARIPILLDNQVIQINIDNKAQQQAIERDKTFILDFLRQELNHPNISITTFIEESNDTLTLYTNKDKFKRLAEKNPLLIELQKRLNLDID